MHRPASSSRLSQRYYQRPFSSSSSRTKRPASATPFLYFDDAESAAARILQEEDDDEEVGGEEYLRPPPRPHTSFHCYPEELEEKEGEEEEADGGGWAPGVVVERGCGPGFGSTMVGGDAWGGSGEEDGRGGPVPEPPEPLKLAKEHGYGYRKPDKEVSPHWSQWPQPPTAQKRPGNKSSVDHYHHHHHHPRHHHHRRPVRPSTARPQPTHDYRNTYATQPSAYDPVINTTNTTHHNNGTMSRKYSDEMSVIMHRGLSPRRAAPPAMPGRSLTHYGGFGGGQRDYIGSLDLSVPGHSTHWRPAHSSRSSRESRPMHRHLRASRQEEGYLHNNSIYYSTTPNVMGYFIIHPDWVSERLSMRRSRSLMGF